MSNTTATTATLADIKRHIAVNRPESMRVTIFTAGSEFTLATGTTEFGAVTVGDLLRLCETSAESGATFALHI